ncbi:MAG: hypothetical protein ACOYL5_13760 [Phototrophicaceae bacterium]
MNAISTAPKQHPNRWICPNCGQIYWGEAPPDLCDFCGDFTTWQPIQDNPPRTNHQPEPPKPSPIQLRLF